MEEEIELGDGHRARTEESYAAGEYGLWFRLSPVPSLAWGIEFANRMQQVARVVVDGDAAFAVVTQSPTTHRLGIVGPKPEYIVPGPQRIAVVAGAVAPLLTNGSFERPVSPCNLPGLRAVRLER